MLHMWDAAATRCDPRCVMLTSLVLAADAVLECEALSPSRWRWAGAETHAVLCQDGNAFNRCGALFFALQAKSELWGTADRPAVRHLWY